MKPSIGSHLGSFFGRLLLTAIACVGVYILTLLDALIFGGNLAVFGYFAGIAGLAWALVRGGYGALAAFVCFVGLAGPVWTVGRGGYGWGLCYITAIAVAMWALAAFSPRSRERR